MCLLEGGRLLTHRRRHFRQDGLAGLAFHQCDRAGAARYQEIHFQSLLVAEVVQFAAPAGMGLAI